MFKLNRIKKEQTGIEPVTLGPAIPCSTTELLFLTVNIQSMIRYIFLSSYRKIRRRYLIFINFNL